MGLPTTPDGRVVLLAVAREARGLTCADLGDAVGASAQQVSAWERGVSEPTAGQWAALALRLGWPVAELKRRAPSEKVAWAITTAARNRMVRGIRNLSAEEHD